MEFRTIRYIKRKNINMEGCNISSKAKFELDSAKSDDNMILRIMIDNDNKINIEFAGIICIENIRKACKFNN